MTETRVKGPKSRTKLTAQHKAYLKKAIMRTPTLNNTVLRERLLAKFDDIESIDPTTIGRYLKNELGLVRRRMLLKEKDVSQLYKKMK